MPDFGYVYEVMHESRMNICKYCSHPKPSTLDCKKLIYSTWIQVNQTRIDFFLVFRNWCRKYTQISLFFQLKINVCCSVRQLSDNSNWVVFLPKWSFQEYKRQQKSSKPNFLSSSLHKYNNWYITSLDFYWLLKLLSPCFQEGSQKHEKDYWRFTKGSINAGGPRAASNVSKENQVNIGWVEILPVWTSCHTQPIPTKTALKFVKDWIVLI